MSANRYDSDVYAALMADASAHHTERTAFDESPRGFAIIDLYRSAPKAAAEAFRTEFYTEAGDAWRERTTAARAIGERMPKVAFRCPECGTVWTVDDDPNEWAYGHDCEA